MSFLNMSCSLTASRGDLSVSRSVEGAFRFADDLEPEDFMELLTRRLNDLEKDVVRFDEVNASKKQAKTFLHKSSRRLNDVVDVLKRLAKEQELLADIPEEYLLKADVQIQAVRRILHSKKVNPDHLSILGKSYNEEHDEEGQSLMADQSFDKQGRKNIDLDTTVIRDRRLRGIEEKYEYVNMICADLANLVDQQGQCIQAIDGNLESGTKNTSKAKDEFGKLHAQREGNGRKLFVAGCLVVVSAIGTLLILKPELRTSLNFVFGH